MKVKQYQELIVWQKAMDLVEEVYKASKAFPREEMDLQANLGGPLFQFRRISQRDKVDAQLSTFCVTCRLGTARSWNLKPKY